MSKVLARVTQPTDGPRGPDVELGVFVPAAWLEQGATLEIELPRNLACAGCSGGGCDACGRSGAVTLRGRNEPPEIVQVTLPRPEGAVGASTDRQRTLVLRIPERGGLPDADSGLPRGHLLLAIRSGDQPDAGVAKVRRSILPPAQGESEVAPSPRRVLAVLIVLLLFLAFIAWQIVGAVR